MYQNFFIGDSDLAYNIVRDTIKYAAQNFHIGELENTNPLYLLLFISNGTMFLSNLLIPFAALRIMKTRFCLCSDM